MEKMIERLIENFHSSKDALLVGVAVFIIYYVALFYFSNRKNKSEKQSIKYILTSGKNKMFLYTDEETSQTEAFQQKLREGERFLENIDKKTLVKNQVNIHA
jgi:hypothetical protein